MTSPRRSAVANWGDRVRLARFFAQLAVKEHLAPGLPVRPLVAELFLTDNCNLKCVSCACWRTVTRRELTGDEWRGVIDQLADYGILKANFTGGEPLLRRDAPRAHGLRLSSGASATCTSTPTRSCSTTVGVTRCSTRACAASTSPSTARRAEVHERVRGVPGSFAKTVDEPASACSREREPARGCGSG